MQTSLSYLQLVLTVWAGRGRAGQGRAVRLLSPLTLYGVRVIILDMVLRATLPERVFGSFLMAMAERKLATGPTCSLTAFTISCSSCFSSIDVPVSQCHINVQYVTQHSNMRHSTSCRHSLWITKTICTASTQFERVYIMK